MSIDKIICVGKNYLEHAKELGDPVPEQPVLFLKPASVLCQAAAWDERLVLDFPEDAMVQPECEIVLRVSQDGYKMSVEQARVAISHLSIGLDMTLRARQTELKKQGHPWTTAKVFKDAAVVGPWIPYQHFTDYLDTPFYMLIDDVPKQSAKGSMMMTQPADLLVYISQFFPLKKGDLIYTGTPAGVSSISQNSLAELRWGNYAYSVTWR